MKLKEFLERHQDVELTEEQEKHIKEYLGIKDKKWSPKEEETYYLIDSAGSICERKRCSIIPNADENDRFRMFTNNCFKTQKEAWFRLEQIKVYNELKNFADENNEEIDWEDNSIKKWFIMYDYSNLGIIFNYYFQLQHIGNIYFTSQELAEQAVEKVGSVRIKKYLFGVKDAKN